MASTPDDPKSNSAEETKAAFEFDYGRLCLALVGTLRERDGLRLELLRSPRDLARWCRRAGVLTTMPEAPEPADLVLARSLREAVFSLISTCAAGRAPDPSTVSTINGFAQRSPPTPHLTASADGVRWHATHPVRACLSAVARDAIELVAGDDLARVKSCASPTCSALFVDRSRPGSRRWCSMQRCGNRAKQSSRRRRQRPLDTPGPSVG